MSDDALLIRSSSLMALGTIFSRATGLVRNLLLVAVLGTALLGDVYNVANTMPNILYNLLIGGALTAVFVPQIIRASRENDRGSAYISRLFTATSSGLLLIVVVATLLAPVLVHLYAPSFSGRSFDITVAFMRYCLPQIFFLGIFALLGQIANARGVFGPMMWAPILNNLIAIALFTYFLTSVSDL
ncbi:MAG: lipid II flippase MurJ, partial [Actinomycetes bacterium]